MKIPVATIATFVLLFSACEKADDQLALGPDLREGLLEIQRKNELSDQEMVEGLREWYSVEQIAFREDIWGAGGMEAFARNLLKEQEEQMRRGETMNMLNEVFILEYLQKDDVEGAKETLRSNLANRYREELRKGTPRDDSMMAKVEKLAEGDPELRRLMNEKPDGEQGTAPNP